MLRELRLLQGISSTQSTKPCTGVCLEGDTTLRLRATAKLYHAGKIDRVVVSGGLNEPHLDRLPAAAMKQKLIKMGLPEETVILEEQSENTLHQARLVSSIAKERGFSRLLIIASGYHLLRAYRTFLRVALAQDLPFSLYGYPAGPAWTWFLRSPTEGRYRFLLFFDELAKIREYGNDVASLEETWQYLQSLNAR
jgi:uncharacterized SAM-binding protein YcdF (DUF218 family)